MQEDVTRGAVREPDLFILGVLQAEYHNSLKNGFHEHHLLNAPNTFSTLEFDNKYYIIILMKNQPIKIRNATLFELRSSWRCESRSNPPTVALPPVGRFCVESISIRVVFPAPFNPSRAKHSPSPTVKDTPSTLDSKINFGVYQKNNTPTYLICEYNKHKKTTSCRKKNACDSSSVYELAVCLKFPKDLYLVIKFYCHCYSFSMSSVRVFILTGRSQFYYTRTEFLFRYHIGTSLFLTPGLSGGFLLQINDQMPKNWDI